MRRKLNNEDGQGISSLPPFLPDYFLFINGSAEILEEGVAGH